MSQSLFSSLPLHSDLLSNLESLDFKTMTPIQAESLPAILAGKDVIGQGKTGSGKTAAFGLGLLNKLDVSQMQIQSLILCPTRELADQVASELRRLGRAIPNVKILTLCGGAAFGAQIASLEFGCHIVVGTPGRIDELMRKGKLKLDLLSTFVLDEADRMLDMGFQDTVDAIIALLPAEKQTLLFSATFPPQIEKISQRIMREPVRVEADTVHVSSTIEHNLYPLDEGVDRMTAVRLLILEHSPESAVVFCNTKKETQALADELKRYGFNVLALHGDLEQRDRDQTLVKFANKSITILVATDVAARGLDIDSINIVINYQMAHETEVHIHRIGRTGRAGGSGIACTLFDPKERYKLAQLEDYLGHAIEKKALPSINVLEKPVYKSKMITLMIDGGKKQKLRAGDILGALTGDNGVTGNDVGKIQIFDNRAFVAVKRKAGTVALTKLVEGKLKGRSFKVRRIS